MAEYDVVYVGFVTGDGGDALHMLTLAHGMQQVGLRSKIIVPASSKSEAFAARCASAGVAYELSPVVAVGGDGSHHSFPSLTGLLRKNRAPIVHLHTGDSCLPRRLLLSLELLRLPNVVATVHSPYETISHCSPRARTWAFFANRRLGAVISPSDHGARFQQKCGVRPGRSVTVRNGIETSRFASGNPAGPRALLGLPGHVPIVLFCSRMEPQKRPVEAVEAFARVADQFPDAHLVFVGTGSEERRVQDAARRLGVADRTHLVGFQANIPDWLAAATVWFVPTERENFSVALLEALAAGCPILSTECPGNNEVLVAGRNALTFAVGDIAASARGLERLLGDAQLRGRLQDEARRTAENYSVESLVNGMQAVYSRVGHRSPSLS